MTISAGAATGYICTNAKLEAKYMVMVRNVLTRAQARASLDVMWYLEDVEDVGQVLDHLQCKAYLCKLIQLFKDF